MRWTNAYFSFSKHRRWKDGNHSFIPNSKVEARSIFDRHISLELAVDRSISAISATLPPFCNDPLFASFLHDTELSSSPLSSRTTGNKVNVAYFGLLGRDPSQFLPAHDLVITIQSF